MIDKFFGETRWLSNFHECEITVDGITYPTTEHAYQAQKTRNIRARKAIAKLPKPADAKAIGSVLKIRDNWHLMNIQLMYEINKIKFNTNKELKEKLLNTGEEELIEGNTWGDTFWGVVNGIGENHLGKILMRIREELKNNA